MTPYSFFRNPFYIPRGARGVRERRKTVVERLARCLLLALLYKLRESGVPWPVHEARLQKLLFLALYAPQLRLDPARERPVRDWVYGPHGAFSREVSRAIAELVREGLLEPQGELLYGVTERGLGEARRAYERLSEELRRRIDLVVELHGMKPLAALVDATFKALNVPREGRAVVQGASVERIVEARREVERLASEGLILGE